MSRVEQGIAIEGPLIRIKASGRQSHKPLSGAVCAPPTHRGEEGEEGEVGCHTSIFTAWIDSKTV